MDEDDDQGADLMIPLPSVFWSFETEAPIRKCLVCEGDLIKSGEAYMIEKAFAKEEVVFEYGICIACHTGMMQELSEQSLKLIRHYFEEHVDVAGRRARIQSGFDGSVLPWISRCMFTGKSVVEADEYQILGMCIGDELVLGDLPQAISGEAVAAIQGLLSDQTRGYMDDFTGKYFGVPTGADIPTILPL